MGKPIPFPGNFDAYVNKAMLSFETGDLEKSIEEIQKALEIYPDENLLRFCLTMMQELEQYEEGVLILDRQQPSLRRSTQMNDLDIQLISFLTKAGHLEEAATQIQQRKKASHLPEEKPLFSLLEQNLQEMEEQEKKKNKDLKALLYRASKTITEKSYHEQNRFIGQYSVLPDADFQMISEELLLSPQVDAILKTEILQKMLWKSLTGTVQVSKGNYQKEVDLSLLAPMPFSVFLQKGLEEIQVRFEEDVNKKEMLMDNFFLHCAFFYPFEKEALHSAAEWSAVVLGRSAGKELLYTKSEEEIKRNVIQAEQSLDRLSTL